MNLAGAFLETITTGFGFVGFVTAQGLVGWLALVLSGRAFDAVNSSTEASLKDNAVAGAVVMGLTALGGILLTWFSVLGFPIPFETHAIVLLYVVLIYWAFQLDGFFDVILFFFIHGALLMGLHVVGVDRMLRMDIWY